MENTGTIRCAITPPHAPHETFDGQMCNGGQAPCSNPNPHKPHNFNLALHRGESAVQGPEDSHCEGVPGTDPLKKYGDGSKAIAKGLAKAAESGELKPGDLLTFRIVSIRQVGMGMSFLVQSEDEGPFGKELFVVKRAEWQ